MRKALLASLATLLVLAATEARAWIVPCDPDDLDRCKTACSNAGGEIITNPHDGSKWCKIPYRIKTGSGGATSRNAQILTEGGMDLSKGREDFSPAGTRPAAQ